MRKTALLMTPRSAPPTIFLHIPKTAGTTFNVVLRRQFEPKAVHAIRSDRMLANIEAFKAMPESQRHAIQLLQGHFAFGLHAYLAPGARYLTVLRDPVARIVSHYHYVKSTSHPMFIDAIRGGNMSLLDYAVSGISGELENGQTRWLAGILDDRPLTRADYERALSNIENHFDWVGLAESFDESLVELALRRRWPRIYYRKQNVSTAKARDRSMAEAAEAIASRNQMDIELHREMSARFQARSLPYRVCRSALAAALRLISR